MHEGKDIYLQNLKSNKLSNKAKYCGIEELPKSLEETVTSSSIIKIKCIGGRTALRIKSEEEIRNPKTMPVEGQ